MTAGQSAAEEAERQLALADLHGAAEKEARELARNFAIAAETEASTMRTLAHLSPLGYHFLADRRWPGSRSAQVDLVVIGPAGVFIIDTKAWSEVSVQQDRIFRGDADVTEEILNLAELADGLEADLAAIGLAPGEVHVIAAFADKARINERVGPVEIRGERDLLNRIARSNRRLTENQVEAVLARTLAYMPRVGAPAPVVASVPEPVLAPAPDEEPLALITEEEVRDSLLQAVLDAPIEEWMSFLHPDQAKLARRQFNGPSRIRGAAGTGKTVVGLHRAAYLARTRPGRVLVTTYVRTLPDVLKSLLERMDSEVAPRVEFMGVYGFAGDVLAARGIRSRLNPKAAREAFDAAWNALDKSDPLRAKGLSDAYWRDEIAHVIKGRGITRFDEYAELRRTGRRHVLGVDQRRAVWALYSRYTEELQKRSTWDFEDVILRADQELAREPLEDPYMAVVVDEVQDLSAVMVRMLHRIVGDVPDGLTLIGDGQQSIYPGGYTLSEIGISVAGRSAVMQTNYRNTREILDFAASAVAGSEIDDIEGEIARGDMPAEVPRSGVEPILERCSNSALHDARLVQRVTSLQKLVDVAPGDIGVLCATHKSVTRIAGQLERAGVKVINLEKYSGGAVDAVKVGTIKRAKGLEFKQVCVADVWASLYDGPGPENDETARERWEISRRELFVGMTRARDGLWVGVVGK